MSNILKSKEKSGEGGGGGGGQRFGFRFRRRSSLSGGKVGGESEPAMYSSSSRGGGGGSAAGVAELLDQRHEALLGQIEQIADRLRDELLRALTTSQTKVQDGQMKLKNDVASVRQQLSVLQMRVEDRWLG